MERGRKTLELLDREEEVKMVVEQELRAAEAEAEAQEKADAARSGK